MVAIMVGCSFSFSLIRRAEQKNPDIVSFTDIAYLTYGRIGARLVDCLLMFTQVSSCICSSSRLGRSLTVAVNMMMMVMALFSWAPSFCTIVRFLLCVRGIRFSEYGQLPPRLGLVCFPSIFLH